MIKIYTTENCTRCNLIKSTLKATNKDYEEIKITGLNRNKILSQFPEIKSAPIITVNDKYISYEDFLKELKK